MSSGIPAHMKPHGCDGLLWSMPYPATATLNYPPVPAPPSPGPTQPQPQPQPEATGKLMQGGMSSSGPAITTFNHSIMPAATVHVQNEEALFNNRHKGSTHRHSYTLRYSPLLLIYSIVPAFFSSFFINKNPFPTFTLDTGVPGRDNTGAQ